MATIAAQAGGEWPKKVRAAAEALSGDGAATRGDGDGVELLGDIKAAFNGPPEQHTIFTRTLVGTLIADEERPWAVYGKTGKPITDRKIAELLGGFGIISGTVRIGDATAKGYKRADFEEAWQRYPKSKPKDGPGQDAMASSRPLPDFQPSQRHDADKTGASDDFSSVAKSECDARKNGDLSNKASDCDSVTVCADEEEVSWTL